MDKNNLMENDFMDNATMSTEPTETVKVTETFEVLEKKPEAEKKVIKINRKAVVIAVIVIAVLVLAYFLKGLFIAATVNGSPIGRLSVIQKLEKASGKNLIDSIISTKLVNAEAVAKNIMVSDEEVDTQIKTIEAQVTAQGGTLDAALALQGMSREDLKEQIVFQKQVEKLVADKVTVTDEEVTKYIADNKITVPAGQEAVANSQIKTELSNQKLNTAAEALITTLKSQAKINYFVKY
ncbi:MAG TPA: hypothetical protein PLH37_03255 [bacterium]|nr:hypothetical protein [bacterium]